MFVSDYKKGEIKIKPKKTMAFPLPGKSPEESKRISWLSIFSSIMQARPNCNTEDIEKAKDLAFEIANELFDAYSPKEIKDTDGNPIPFPSGKNICKVCGSELRLVPAGKSKKTGQPYDAFYSCPNRCKQ